MQIEDIIRTKWNQLNDYLTELAPGGLCVAFSGGVDSALLLKAACMTGASVHAVTVYTLFHSPLEPEQAVATAREYGAVHHLLKPPLPAAVLENPADRCYLCKSTLFQGLRELADREGLTHLVDGTNADDLGEYRPGLAALKELGVHSPLAELGISKEEVRAMARMLGLAVAQKPSAPCLATRFPYDHAVRPELLPVIDRVEELVRGLGIGVVRARVEGPTLRLEVPPDHFPQLLEHRQEILDLVLEGGMVGVSLDLEGFRSGSMDRRREREAAVAQASRQPQGV